jgi:pilus assembly protein CpaB
VAIDDIISGGQRGGRPTASRRSGSRAIVFWTLALVAGGSSAGLLKWYLDKRQAGAPVTSQVVVAAMDLPLATTLKPEHLALIEWPRDVRPSGTITDIKDAVGRVLVSRLVQAEPVMTSKLAAREAGSGLAALIPPNMRAAAVRVDDVVGVAGFIHPEDRVDVLVTIRPENGETASKVILQNVKVLAVGKQIEVEEKSRGKSLPVTVATLLVTPEQSERLALAASQGKLLLTLRSWTDEAEVATQGIMPSDLLAGTGRKPAPEPIARVADRPRRRAASPEPKVAQVPAKEVGVEILRGDRFEQRKFEGKEER